ncbi:MAG TPA: DUF4198 domain-containing protein [Vicinamibacteria bacterium]|nr:DUF4198 domain-containing protein [Vicinamibacteria bacterium]
MKRLLGGALWLAAAAVASAHDTWMLPRAFHVAPGATVRLGLTSGMAFPRDESAIKPDRVARSGMRLGGRTVPLRAAAGRHALALSGVAGPAGLATLFVELKPRTLDLTPEQVEEYLEEIGATETAGPKWRARKDRRWRESYVKLAKSFVAVGDESDASWATPVGLSLELVPESDPSRLRAGQGLVVRVLLDGAPLAGQPVGAVGPRGSVPARPTDETGRVRFDLDAAGPWLIRSTRLDEAGGAEPLLDWRSRFATLTFAVAP